MRVKSREVGRGRSRGSGKAPAAARRSRRGRPASQGRPGRGGADRRAAILEVARQAFATRGYDHTGLRDIARLAGVDKRLLTHYFGSKQRLFADALDSAASRFEVQDRRAYASFGTDFVEHIFGAAQLPPEVRLEFISLCLHSSASPAGRELIAANITRQIGRIAANLNGTDAALRASLLLAGLLGISVLREVLAIEPLLHLGPRTARQHIAPWLQSLLDPQRSRPGARR